MMDVVARTTGERPECDPAPSGAAGDWIQCVGRPLSVAAANRRRSSMPLRDKDTWNRDDEMKPGSPPRSTTEPDRAGSTDSPKTMTDPPTGEPHEAPPTPNRAG